MQALGIGTWQNVGTSLTLGVNTNVPVKGNGMTLGLTDGIQNAGMFSGYTYGASNTSLNAKISDYGTNVGSTSSGSSGNIWNSKTVGVTTDPTKSGIVGTVTRTQITVNVFQRIS